jgi:NADPH-dependent curcumin reductase CurA
MTNFHNLSVVVAKRASGIPGPDNFSVVDLDRPRATDGTVVVRVRYAPVDPAMRGWLSSEADAIAARDPMHARGARKYRVRPWMANEGTMTVKLAFTTRSFEVL